MLTDRNELARWWGPGGFTMPHADLDLRVGGAYRFTMKPPQGDGFHLGGEYVEIDPPSRLAYTFRYEEPTPDDRETKLSLSQSSFATEERRALHEGGSRASFDRLREVLAS
jgi:uncharacterized protein YndB with AHSA1/START domain